MQAILNFFREKMSLPNVDVVRSRIESIPRRDIRNCVMTTYLFAGRITEVVGRVSPRDNTTARGPKGTDVETAVYKLGPLEEPAVVFTVRTAKVGGKKRLVALPVNYEPWSSSVYRYFQEAGKAPVFPFTRQLVGKYVQDNKIFGGMVYPIERYVIYEGELKRMVEAHNRPFNLHALRHLRASELVEYYGFNAFDLATYCGWTYRTAVGMSSVDRYLSLGWQGYFPKLLKRR